MKRICPDRGHRNWLYKTGEVCTCPKWVPASDYDALAAHVERLDAGVDQLLRASCEDEADEAMAAINDARADEPTHSLALRDARMKAEALDDAADVIDRVGADYPQGFLRGRAAKIRQQAEGGGDE